MACVIVVSPVVVEFVHSLVVGESDILVLQYLRDWLSR